ncbi:MAG TPA: hypothetical protein VFA81_08020 [Burkholderiales bacterium]|nr:hypothetical protein [Burkholderiales bacterium]
MRGRDDKPVHRWLDAPEVNIVIFSFLLNMIWEFWQTPFFAGLAAAQHSQAVIMCTRAAVGDAMISLVAFCAVSVCAKMRRWYVNPVRWQTLMFVGIGLVLTIVLETLATHVLDRWHYAEAMPIMPAIGVGLLPILQWLVLPPLVLWFVRRQLR